MKKKVFLNIIGVLLVSFALLTACKKDEKAATIPMVATTPMTNIGSYTATAVGFLFNDGGDAILERGVCWNTATAPTIANFTNKITTGGAQYSVALTGLTHLTKYYVRAYAKNNIGVVYGEEINFTTLPILPTVTTTAITAIAGISATGGGNVTDDGKATVTARGICWSTSPAPTIAGSKTTNGSATGAFTSSLTGLKGVVKYYVRAYATNSQGTAYGPEISFTTLPALPTVSTTAVTSIAKTTASTGGNVTEDGGVAIIERGICYSLVTNPTIADIKIVDPANTKGVFTSAMTGLTTDTKYYVRSYATNSVGTAYGLEVTFSSLPDIYKLWVVGTNNGWDNSDNAPFILSTVTSSGTCEGYVNFTGAGPHEFKLTSDHSWADAGTYGDNGTALLQLGHGGGNIPVPAPGYYKIEANISTVPMTYKITNTVWGLIGSATAGGWGAQTDMVYNATTKKFTLTTPLKTGQQFKFRGTSDWSLNYGVTATKFVGGGDNIDVTIAGDLDYDVTLDLSNPTLYSYSAYTWGIIGDATTGQWSTDQNMTYDYTNKVWKATMVLTSTGTKTIKFRANDDWPMNLGIDAAGAAGALKEGGDNIVIPASGTYNITLNTITKTYTIVLVP